MINRDWISLYKKELEKIGLNLEKYLIQFGEIWAVLK